MKLIYAALVLAGGAAFAAKGESQSALHGDGARIQRPLAHYNHRAWRLVDNAPPDIWAMTQSPDGFLWLGTGAGLFRFDGIRFEDVSPRVGTWPSNNITALLASPDGTIWIGHFTGEISRLRAGRLENWAEGNAAVEQFARQPDGTIWAAKTGPGGGLFRFDGKHWLRTGADNGISDKQASSVLAARDGAVWVATEHHILMRPAGAARFRVMRNSSGIVRLAQAPDGQVWATGSADAAAETAHSHSQLAIVPSPPGEHVPGADRMTFSRDGTLWATAFDGGLIQIRGLSARSRSAPVFERFLPADGLTSPIAVPVLQDREGNIWIGTNLGLNRLRPVSARTALELPAGKRGGFLITATRDGAVFAASANNLYRALPGKDMRLLRTFPHRISFVEADGAGLIVGQPGLVFRLEDGRLASIPIPNSPGVLTYWAPGGSGTVWVNVKNRGIKVLRNGRWQAPPLKVLPANSRIAPLASGPHTGRWIISGNRLFQREGLTVREFPQDGAPRIGRISTISLAPDGTVLAGGELGLARLSQGKFQTLDVSRVPELTRISGIAQWTDDTIWINGIKGLIRIRKSDLDRAFSDPKAHLDLQLFNAANGLPGVAQQDATQSTVARGGDGRIWVADNVGVGMLDPARLVSNHLLPPVVIRDVTANNRTVSPSSRIDLPAGTQNLRITYTALSLAAAEQVRFRYRLIGVDRDWIDAGTRREAFYANLPPGDWRFQVIAANNDGIWNTRGASMEVSIAPAFYQRWWFRLIALAVLIGLASLIYVWRVRAHMARARSLAQVQMAERERIARELHDTLLQGMQGLILRFQAAANVVTPGSRAHTLLEQALERGDDVILEARDRVRGLRAADGPAALFANLENIASRYREGGLPVSVHGNDVDLAPTQIEQIRAIVEEALSNVLHHAKANTAAISTKLRNGQLMLDVTDDGSGISPTILREGAPSGHFGLMGMRERAEALGGTLRIVAANGGGTTVSITIPLKQNNHRPSGESRLFLDETVPPWGSIRRATE